MSNRYLLITFLVSCTCSLFGQTQGISYQAVIINQNAKEIPGVDVQGNYMPNESLTVRFTILNESEDIDYQEEHETTTDAFGMINLIIGTGEPTSSGLPSFIDIDWDGTPKSLLVEIDIQSSPGLVELSYQPLYFVPYAFHKNITATGTLTVDGKATFNGEAEFQDLTVQGTTDLNGPLNVNNGSASTLSGDLAVTGSTTLSSNLSVDGPTVLANTLTVEQLTTLNDNLTVNAETGLNGQVTITADVNGTDNNYDAYPLRVQGSNQGIGITVDGSRTNANNFVTFWDSQGMQGRIEGQIDSDVYTDPEYIFTHVIFGLKTATQVANVAIAAGFTVLDPGNVPIEAANSVVLAAEIAQYEIFAFSNLGVTYQSGAGDYAEWLPRLDTAEQISPGQVVGVFAGKISRKTEGADMIMAVSSAPIVLGNTPQSGTEHYEKIAFMGQIPVWVFGPVKKGDFIIPFKSGTGLGKAVPPSKLMPDMMDKIVGRAWENGTEEINLINTVVGFNTNEIAYFTQQNRTEIDSLKGEINNLKFQMERTHALLAQLIPEYKSKYQNLPAEQHHEDRRETIHESNLTFTEENLESIFSQTEQLLTEQGYDVSSHPFYSRIHSDPEFKRHIIEEILKIYGDGN